MAEAASPHVAVIGAGTLGMCCAVHLVEQGARVTVLDKNAIASGSSGRSVGVIGTQFTDEFQIALRSHAMQRFREWEREGLRINRIGYLRLARTAGQMTLFERSVRLQAAFGFRSRLYVGDELLQLVPHLSTDGLAGGIFGPDDGFIDPHELCMLLAAKVREAGSTIKQFVQVLGHQRCPGGHRLETSAGPVGCDVVINAGGAWASDIAALLGQTLHVRPERHEAITVHLDEPLPYTMPMVMDLVNGEGTGLNFRHEKNCQLIAEIHQVASSLPDDPDTYNDQCEEASKIHLAQLLLERVPDLPGPRLGRGWAGLYPMTADQRPFVGAIEPSDPTIVTAAGAGGYGIQLSPTIGLAAADWALRGGPVSAPVLGLWAPTIERNIAA